MLRRRCRRYDCASMSSLLSRLPRSMVRYFATAVVIIVTFYVVLIVALWRGQVRIIWHPPRVETHVDQEVRRIAYTADDGQRLHAFLIGDLADAPGLLIFFHGNAEVATWRSPWAREVMQHTGWAVLLPEYRGYDGLTGTPSYESSRRDAVAAYRIALQQTGVDSTRIAFYGHSLGSAVAAELATSHRPAALILGSPFTSLREMVRQVAGPMVSTTWRAIGRVRFDTRARVATLDVPVSVSHGDRDLVIPVRMGREVYASARRPAELLIVRGAGHNDVPDIGGDAYWTWLSRALAAAIAAR